MARAIELVFNPVHLNVQVLENEVPHVHAHVICRYDPDPAPGMPLSSDTWTAAPTVPDADLAAQVGRLRAAATGVR